MAHAHYMLDTYGYKHALTICNTYCFSTATMVARTRLIVTLWLHCLSFFMFQFTPQPYRSSFDVSSQHLFSCLTFPMLAVFLIHLIGLYEFIIIFRELCEFWNFSFSTDFYHFKSPSSTCLEHLVPSYLKQ